MGEFSEKVFAAVRRVPRGKVTTYGQIASLIGSPRSARYVGYALRGNPEPSAKDAAGANAARANAPEAARVANAGDTRAAGAANAGDAQAAGAMKSDGIPCHRVIFKDGSLCDNYAFGGMEVQRALLEAEGVTFADDAHVDMDACLWDGRTEGAGCAGERGTRAGEPTVPPPDFDWKRELGETD